MDSEPITVPSATGVDVALDVAGPGSRSYAFIIDWHIRVLLAVAWFVPAALLAAGGLTTIGVERGLVPRYVLAAVLPAVLIYAFYHPVLEVLMRGRTPGKRAAGVRLVTHAGGTPSVGALVLRNVFRLIDMLPMFYVVGFVTTLVTASRVRVGDLAAGTVLVHDHAAAVEALAGLGALARDSRLSPAALELVTDLLDRWSTLADGSRQTLARTLLARLEAQADAAALATLDSAELRQRLEALQHGGPPQ